MLFFNNALTRPNADSLIKCRHQQKYWNVSNEIMLSLTSDEISSKKSNLYLETIRTISALGISTQREASDSNFSLSFLYIHVTSFVHPRDKKKIFISKTKRN